MVSSPLRRYFEEKFFIIPIAKNDKRPLFRKWNQYPLSYNETKQYIKNGYNIAVVAKDMWILDYDRPVWTPKIRDNIDYYRSFKTVIQFTPHGYHVFYKGQNPLLLNQCAKPETVRHGDMYALIAPSKIDGKSYWWLDDMKGEILTL